MSDVILRFRGGRRFLSNFYPCFVWLIQPDDLRTVEVYRSVEHAYQACKTRSAEERAEIRNVESPGAAKRLGRRVTVRPDWEEIKVGVMRTLLTQKFSDLNPELVIALENTGEDYLVEGNNWHDSFWGVCVCQSCLGKGENMLGKLLMQRRAELR